MLKFVVKRILSLIPILLGVVFLVFTLMYFLPGGAVSRMSIYGGDTLDSFFNALGWGPDFFSRFLRYAFNVITKLELGVSSNTGRFVSDDILMRLPRTLTLAGFAVVLVCLVGPPIGMYAALHHNTWRDNGVMTFALLGSSVPSYVLGILLMLFFSLVLGWLPASGYYGPEYYILPVLTLSVGGIASTARMTRSALLDILGEDYVTTARAKGLRERRVVLRHALKNALVPIITIITGQFAQLLGGAYVIEAVFSIPGIGKYMVDAISNRDLSGLQGCIILLAVLISVINILADVAYVAIDPQIKARYSGGRREKNASVRKV